MITQRMGLAMGLAIKIPHGLLPSLAIGAARQRLEYSQDPLRRVNAASGSQRNWVKKFVTK